MPPQFLALALLAACVSQVLLWVALAALTAKLRRLRQVLEFSTPDALLVRPEVQALRREVAELRNTLLWKELECPL